MTLYTDAAYSPRIGALHFNDSPQIQIIGMDVSEQRETDIYKIPSADGLGSTPPSKGGLELSLTVQIATATLSDFFPRFLALLNVLDGDESGLFDFYLRYEDTDNYWAYTNCQVRHVSEPVGKNNPKSVALNNEVTIDMISLDSTPTVKSSGSFLVGDTDVTASGVNYVGSTTLMIEDSLIIQNTLGQVIFQLNAPANLFQGTGTVNFTL